MKPLPERKVPVIPAIYLFAIVIFGFAATLLRLPPLVGFLAAGFALGASSLPNLEFVDTLGDLGFLDADENLYVMDRAADVIRSGDAAVYLAAYRAEARANPDRVLVGPGPGERWEDWVRQADQAVERGADAQRGAVVTAAAAHLTFNAIILTVVIVAAAIAV